MRFGEEVTLVVVCGLKSEARIAAGEGISVIAGGSDSRALEATLEYAVGEARALLSFGIAGGLASDLKPGDPVVAHAVVAPDGTSFDAHPAWSAYLSKRLGVMLSGFAGVDAPLADVAGKYALHQATGASVVDMESHIAARVAARHRVPFAAVRVVADASDHQLPHAATVGMSPNGRVDIAAVLVSLARDPRQIPALIRTARDARAAFSGLLRCRKLLGDDFGLVDLGDALLDMA